MYHMKYPARICAYDAHGSTATAQRAQALLSQGAKHPGLDGVLAQQPAALSGSLQACTLALLLQASTASTRAALAAVPLASGDSPLHRLPCRRRGGSLGEPPPRSPWRAVARWALGGHAQLFYLGRSGGGR